MSGLTSGGEVGPVNVNRLHARRVGQCGGQLLDRCFVQHEFCFLFLFDVAGKAGAVEDGVSRFDGVAVLALGARNHLLEAVDNRVVQIVHALFDFVEVFLAGCGQGFLPVLEEFAIGG